jgi:putative transposase
MKFKFMKEHSKLFCIEKMAEVLEVGRSGYYEFIKRKPSSRQIDNQKLLEKIRAIHKDSRSIYGSPKIHAELKKQEETCSRKRVAKLMKQNNIQSKIRKKWKVARKFVSTDSCAPNIVNQNFITESPNKIWVSDITYIPTQEGWLYLATVMDLFSRRIIGYCMDNHLQTELVTKALKQALHARKNRGELVHHSDRGCQYTSQEFKKLADIYGIKLSMSAKGHCYDNAVAESFFHTLKTELVAFCKYEGREEAKRSIFEYIEVFYNRKRLHSTIGYLTPVEFEAINYKRVV